MSVQSIKQALKRVIPASMGYLDRKIKGLDGKLKATLRQTEGVAAELRQQTHLIEATNTKIDTVAAEHTRLVEATNTKIDTMAVEHARLIEATDKKIDTMAVEHARLIEATDTKVDTLAAALAEQKRSLDEALWAQVFNSTIADSDWLLNRSISPGRWAVGYPYLYVLYRVLNDARPTSILELGLGQSTKVITQYARFNASSSHTVVEHDERWTEFFERSTKLEDVTKIVNLPVHVTTFLDDDRVTAYQGFAESFEGNKFDLISIDGPFGYNANKYSRIDALTILPGCLSDSFVILVDDFDRPGERQMVEQIKNKLAESSISYKVGVYSGQKQTCVIASEDQSFLCSM